ncbi:PAS domain-containing protein [Undibacterium arcticum]
MTLHSIGDAVITTDAQGIIDYLNPVAQQLTGWSMEGAINKSLMDVLNIVDKKTTSCHCRIRSCRPYRKGPSATFPSIAFLSGRTAGTRRSKNSTAPIRSRDGSIIGAVLVFRDVTASREITAKNRVSSHA